MSEFIFSESGGWKVEGRRGRGGGGAQRETVERWQRESKMYCQERPLMNTGAAVECKLTAQ